MAKKSGKSATLTKSSLKYDDDKTSPAPYTRKYDHLVSFQFKIFNPLKWAMQYLQRIEEDRDGKITLRIPFIWYLTFLIFVVGGSSALGAIFAGPTSFLQGQIAERMLWVSKPTPTPIIVIPTPAPVLVTRFGTIKATYQVKDILPSPTVPNQASVAAVFDSQITPTPVPLRYVLIAENSELIFLKIPQSMSLNNYFGSRVLVTGNLDTTTKVLSVDSEENLEIVY